MATTGSSSSGLRSLLNSVFLTSEPYDAPNPLITFPPFPFNIRRPRGQCRVNESCHLWQLSCRDFGGAQVVKVVAFKREVRGSEPSNSWSTFSLGSALISAAHFVKCDVHYRLINKNCKRLKNSSSTLPSLWSATSLFGRPYTYNVVIFSMLL